MTLSDLVNIKMQSKHKLPGCEKCVYKDRTFVPPTITESEIVVIGEAPGQMEANLKSPFVGDSGKLLRRLMDEVGLDSKSLTYLNTVYCHPPSNETPVRDALKRCPPMFLNADLASLKPKAVILVGSTALNQFFPKEKIMEKKGNILTKDGLTFFPVLHPAYCLRNQTATPMLKADLNKVGRFVRGELFQNRTYVLCDTVEKLQEYRKILSEKDILSCDIETNNNLDPFTTGAKIWTVSFGMAENMAVCIAIDHPESIPGVQELSKEVVQEVLKSKVPKVFQNCVFDLKWLRKFGFEINGICADTMIMAYLLDENRLSYSLKVMAPEFITGYQYAFSDKLADLSNYNCEDADYTLQLYHMFHKQLCVHPKLLDLLNKVIMPFCSIIVDMELTGILIDTEYAAKLKIILQDKLDILHDAIKEDFPSSKNVDLGSPKQLSQLLFNKLKFKPIKSTKTGYSVDHEVLTKLAESQKCGLAKYILGSRKLTKALSTYVDKIPHMVHSDSRDRKSVV
jgi:uracil-DNA glycosylase family 4